MDRLIKICKMLNTIFYNARYAIQRNAQVSDIHISCTWLGCVLNGFIRCLQATLNYIKVMKEKLNANELQMISDQDNIQKNY